MRLLLDTHTFLWWATSPDLLPERAKTVIAAAESEVYLSAASAWEVRIKEGIRRLTLSVPWETIVQREVLTNGVQLLPITFRHTHRLPGLPLIHRDPFDRILMAQALSEDLTLVSGDARISEYPDVPVLWS
jgi:PIN domain nuclease of toxin-antitoxin system